MECQGHDKHLREKKVWVNDENIIYIYFQISLSKNNVYPQIGHLSL